MRPAVLAVVAMASALLLTACEDGEEVPQPTAVQQPASRSEGIQATGTLDGQRVAISRGNPTVVVGDCDANDGLDEDLCILSRTIDGRNVNLVVENPAVLEAGGTVEVVTCSADCDEVTDGAVVEVRLDGEVRPAERGRLVVAEAGPRWVAEFDLRLSSGDRLIGAFDVAPTPPG